MPMKSKKRDIRKEEETGLKKSTKNLFKCITHKTEIISCAEMEL